MVRKEFHSHLIGGTPIRAAMIASTSKLRISPTRLNFTGAMQALEKFAASLRLGGGRFQQRRENPLETLSELHAGKRPGRQGARESKRRVKQFKLMQKPCDPDRKRYPTAA
ncbi:hypothetical protein Mal65_29130 [Crateriforma conspicua]|nr:hypothetical protein Mal65_29130 [Crateriforma conspicua]